jgi:FRG domain
MKEIDVLSWEKLEHRITELKLTHQKAMQGLLFRGQGNSTWLLQTTLERRKGPKFEVKDYYDLIWRIKARIETFTNTQWDAVPDFTELFDLTAAYDRLARMLARGGLPAYKHFAYLRHHGFPSPLLDWTSSPYVAAYFAFANPSHESVSIFVYCDQPENMKFWGQGSPRIDRFGPYVQTHKRHFLQQCEYTICTSFEDEKWLFVPHNAVFQSDMREDPKQDVLWKFNIPASERVKVLRRLEEYNLNAYSLFGSEESLMETLAIRELVLRENKH